MQSTIRYPGGRSRSGPSCEHWKMSQDADALERAITLACWAHRGQRYPSPEAEPYILHPLRVMLAVQGSRAQMAAVLHDVIEDTEAGPGRLREADLPEDVVAAVVALTHRPDESADRRASGLTGGHPARETGGLSGVRMAGCTCRAAARRARVRERQVVREEGSSQATVDRLIPALTANCCWDRPCWRRNCRSWVPSRTVTHRWDRWAGVRAALGPVMAVTIGAGPRPPSRLTGCRPCRSQRRVHGRCLGRVTGCRGADVRPRCPRCLRLRPGRGRRRSRRGR